MPIAQLSDCPSYTVNMFEHIYGGPCTVRSNLNKFELVQVGQGQALYRGWTGLGPCMGRGWIWSSVLSGPSMDRQTDTTKNIT